MKMLFMIGFFIIIIIFMNGCDNQREDDILDNQQAQELERKANYAASLIFNNQFGWNRTTWRSNRNLEGRDIIFVRSEEEANALGISLDTIIAWPSPYSLAKLDALNQVDIDLEWLADFQGKTMEELGLTLPLTIDDIVFNWYNVFYIINDGISLETRRFINNHASQYEHEAMVSRTLIRLLFPGNLEAINELLIKRGFDDDDVLQKSGIYNIVNTSIPSIPFTEEDVRNDPRLIERIIINLLSIEERRNISPEALLLQQLEQND